MIDDILHPFKGIARGLLGTDRDSKLIGIRIGECRKIALCLRMARSEFAAIAIAMEAREGPDRETGLDGEAATARPEGIAQ